MLGSQLARQLAGGAKQVLIVVALLSGKAWIEDSVRAIVREIASSYTGIDIQLSFESKAADADLILQKINNFNLPEPSAISVGLLRSRLAGEKVLCVVMDGHPDFYKSLCRAGFPPECICDEFFVELVIPRGKNSNLMEMLYNQAGHYRHLLYAWTGLRTMPASIKKRYSAVALEGPTAKDVVSLFKRWLLGE